MGDKGQTSKYPEINPPKFLDEDETEDESDRGSRCSFNSEISQENDIDIITMLDFQDDEKREKDMKKKGFKRLLGSLRIKKHHPETRPPVAVLVKNSKPAKDEPNLSHLISRNREYLIKCFCAKEFSKKDLKVIRELAINDKLININVKNFLYNLLMLNPNVLQDCCAINIRRKDMETHPIDVRNCIFEQLSPRNRAFCCEKLFQLKLGVPLLLHNSKTNKDNLYLDSLSTLKYSTQNGQTKLVFEENIPVITFARLGEINWFKSKSYILNKLIMGGKNIESGRDVFYHYNLRHGNRQKYLQNGMIDIGWEFENKPKRVFLNLHGDSNQFIDTLKFAESCSNKVVMFINRKEETILIKEIYSRFADKWLFVVCNPNIKQDIEKSRSRFLHYGNKNETEFLECLKKELNTLIDENETGLRLADFKNKVSNNQVTIFQLITNMNSTDDINMLFKICIDESLDENWSKWSEKEKLKNRVRPSKEKSQEQIFSEIEKDQRIVGRKIYSKCSQFNELLIDFSNNFLKLDCLFDKIASLENATLKVEGLSINKIIRRFAQSCHIKLPCEEFVNLATEMLLNGYPLELIDGDACLIYMEWIKKVFSNLDKKLPRSKVVVVSILGMQSSGKSTLLNSMFGFNFRTSSGRCTNGAHMQLLEVEETLQETLKYTHVLVIDVEGLSSLNKGTIHDNELATTIICMSDLCIVNIMGEDMSKMEGVLKICILAIVRMHKVKLKCGIVFVHQNVTDPNACTLVEASRHNTYQELEKALEFALNEEGLANKLKKTPLEQLFNFDITKDVFYFPHFVNGEPPRTYPSESYFRYVAEMKKNVLLKLQKRGIGFSSLFLRIKDVWIAILNESFVLSFKNTLEVKVYQEIEKNYASSLINLSRVLKNVYSKQRNKLYSDLKHVEVSFNELETIALEATNEIILQLDRYFDEEPNVDIKIDYKTNIVKRLCMQKEEIIRSYAHQLLTIKERLENEVKIANDTLFYEKEFLKQCEKHANSKSQTFEKLWSTFLEQISMPKEGNNELNIKDILTFELRKIFENSTLDKSNFNLDPQNKSSKFRKFCDFFSTNNHKKFEIDEVVFNKSLRFMKRELEKEEEKELVFDEASLNVWVRECNQKVLNTFSDNGSTKIIPQNTVCLITISIFRELLPQMEKMQQSSKSKSLRSMIILKEKEYKRIFLEFREGKSQETMLIEEFPKKIKNSIEEAIIQLVLNQLELELNIHPKFNLYTKHHMICEIFKSYATEYSHEEVFIKVMNFLFDANGAIFEFLLNTIERIYDSKGDNFISKSKSILFKLIEKALKEMHGFFDSKSQNDVMFSDWFDLFVNKLSHELKIPRNEMQVLMDIKVVNTYKFTDEILKSLIKSIEQINFHRSTNIKTKLRKLAEEIFKIRIGCSDQCPFCKMVCEKTIENHDEDHSTTFHICECLNGFHWKSNNSAVLDHCSYSVGSNCSFKFKEEEEYLPYSKYREYGPPLNNWKIEQSDKLKIFWKWFIANYSTQLSQKFGFKLSTDGEIPENWKSIKKEEAISDLFDNGF